VLYGGHSPMGLTLERIMKELPELPLRDHVWPKYLCENKPARLQTGALDRRTSPFP